ncbi:hypothetical protein [Nitratireductor aquibiodomus]|nr:hypothetical protein [Nitratireductor aquibiodomus]
MNRLDLDQHLGHGLGNQGAVGECVGEHGWLSFGDAAFSYQD